MSLSDPTATLMFAEAADAAAVVSRQLIKQVLLGAEIARTVLFLAADDSRMISAQDFIVDGGWAHG